MAKKARDVGAEILQGLREIKRGDFGRVINVPDVGQTRKKRACPKRVSPSCSAFPCGLCRNGSKAAACRPAPPGRYC